MITDRDIRRIRQLKSEARLAPTKIKWLNIVAWRIGISVDLHDGLTQWAFSARLRDPSHSTEDDWADLGRIVGAVGAPPEPVVPIPEIKPSDVQHWAWLQGADGKPIPLSMEKERVEAIREAVRTRVTS